MNAISADGTAIAYWKSGAGTPLVLLHGISSDHTRWDALAPILAQQHTVYTMDRRGRGASGDGAAYSLQREIEDVVAVCAAVGEPVALLGHSFGGLLALEAALRSKSIARLIIYEPWIIAMRILKPGVLKRLHALLASGDRDAMLSYFFLQVVRATPDELERQRQSPTWPTRLGYAQTVLRELAELQDYRFDGLPFRKLNTPTLLLYGGASIPSAGRMVWVAHEALPNSRVQELPGQGHVAMITAPDLLAAKVLAFLDG